MLMCCAWNPILPTAQINIPICLVYCGKTSIVMYISFHHPHLLVYSSFIKDDGDEEEEEEISSAGRIGAEQKYDEAIDETEEEDGLKRYREARSHEMFPDEVDTPLDVAARIR